MAATANNMNTHSPRHSTENISSPTAQSRRSGRTIVSPWTQIVRGESEPIVAVPSSPNIPQITVIEEAIIDTPPTVTSAPSTPAAALVGEEDNSDANGNNGNAGKRPAWNKPSNGNEAGPVMDAVSWPALSESARAPSNKSSSDSLKGLSDGSPSLPVSQGTGAASSSTQKQVTNYANSNPTPNHAVTSRQRSMKRNSVPSSPNGSIPQPPAPQGLAADVPLNSPLPRDHGQRSGSISQSHSVSDHPQQRNSYRNRNIGPHPRGDGAHHQNYGTRRNQDHGNQDWNTHRNFNGRDGHMQPQRVVPRFMRHPPPPPPNTSPFIAPPPVRPFGGPLGFPELASPVYYVQPPPPESLRGVPFIAPMPPVFFPAPDPQLHTRIVNQIDYYFSNDNLIKDTYLRQNMDDQGWVPIKLIAGFNKVSHLTDNIQLILDAMRSSTVVEVQGDKIRKRNDWMRWIMPPSVQFPNASNPQHMAKSSHDMLAGRFQNISLERRSSSGDLSSQSHLPSGDGAGHFSVQMGADRSVSSRNLN